MHLPPSQSLSSLTSSELEVLKYKLDALKQQILALQNAQSPLLRLPGELRNHIFHQAMHAELAARCTYTRSIDAPRVNFFADPYFFQTCRQIRGECFGIWFTEIAVWEELEAKTGSWKMMSTGEVRELWLLKSSLGKCRMVTQMAFCDDEKMKKAVETSTSVCPRKGVVRAASGERLPGMKWWVW